MGLIAGKVYSYRWDLLVLQVRWCLEFVVDVDVDVVVAAAFVAASLSSSFDIAFESVVVAAVAVAAAAVAYSSLPVLVVILEDSV